MRTRPHRVKQHTPSSDLTHIHRQTTANRTPRSQQNPQQPQLEPDHPNHVTTKFSVIECFRPCRKDSSAPQTFSSLETLSHIPPHAVSRAGIPCSRNCHVARWTKTRVHTPSVCSIVFKSAPVNNSTSKSLKFNVALCVLSVAAMQLLHCIQCIWWHSECDRQTRTVQESSLDQWPLSGCRLRLEARRLKEVWRRKGTQSLLLSRNGNTFAFFEYRFNLTVFQHCLCGPKMFETGQQKFPLSEMKMLDRPKTGHLDKCITKKQKAILSSLCFSPNPWQNKNIVI